MGFLDSTSVTVDAILTKRGRELLAKGEGEFKITRFSLSDDEVDYGMWESIEPTNLRGRVIENMPLLESFVNQKEIMNSFIINQPDIPQGNLISNVPSVIELEGVDEIIDIYQEFLPKSALRAPDILMAQIFLLDFLKSIRL